MSLHFFTNAASFFMLLNFLLINMFKVSLKCVQLKLKIGDTKNNFDFHQTKSDFGTVNATIFGESHR